MTDEPALIRLMKTGFTRYTADPSTREQSARTMLKAALCLYAAQTNAGDAAITASEMIAVVAADERRQARAAG